MGVLNQYGEIGQEMGVLNQYGEIGQEMGYWISICCTYVR